MSDRDIGTLRGKVILETEEFRKSNTDVIKSVDQSEQSFKRFFQQQRTGDRIQREAAQSLIGLTSAFGSLTGRGVEPFNRAAMASVNGMQQMEFAMFSLQRVGGTLGASIAALAGPITLVVAAGFGLITFFQNANKEAAELDKKIADLEKRLQPEGQRTTALFAEKQSLTGQISRMEEERKRFLDRFGARGRGASFTAFLESAWGIPSEEDIKQLRVRLLEVRNEIVAIGGGSKGGDDGGVDLVELNRENEEKKKKDAIEANDEVTEHQLRNAEEVARKTREYIDRDNAKMLADINSMNDFAISENRRRFAAEEAEERRKAQLSRNLMNSTRSVANDLATILGQTGEDWIADLQEALTVLEAMLNLVETIQAISSFFSALPIPPGYYGPPRPPGLDRPGGGGVLTFEINDSEFARALRIVERRDNKRRLD